jgi:hypothetical protein
VKGEDHLRDLGKDEKTILKYILNICGMSVDWINLARSLTDCCEYGNEHYCPESSCSALGCSRGIYISCSRFVLCCADFLIHAYYLFLLAFMIFFLVLSCLSAFLLLLSMLIKTHDYNFLMLLTFIYRVTTNYVSDYVNLFVRKTF